MRKKAKQRKATMKIQYVSAMDIESIVGIAYDELSLTFSGIYTPIRILWN
jgi:hypothetical protein